MQLKQNEKLFFNKNFFHKWSISGQMVLTVKNAQTRKASI